MLFYWYPCIWPGPERQKSKFLFNGKYTHSSRYFRSTHLNQMSELGEANKHKNAGSQSSDNSPEEEISIKPQPFLFFWCQKTPDTGLHTQTHEVRASTTGKAMELRKLAITSNNICGCTSKLKVQSCLEDNACIVLVSLLLFLTPGKKQCWGVLSSKLWWWSFPVVGQKCTVSPCCRTHLWCSPLHTWEVGERSHLSQGLGEVWRMQ